MLVIKIDVNHFYVGLFIGNIINGLTIGIISCINDGATNIITNKHVMSMNSLVYSKNSTALCNSPRKMDLYCRFPDIILIFVFDFINNFFKVHAYLDQIIYKDMA